MEYHDWDSPIRTKRLNEILKSKRKEAGLTQSRGAYEMRCHDSYLQRVEKGKAKPSITFLVDLIELYKIQDAQTIHKIWWLARGHAPPGNVNPLAGMSIDSNFRDLVLQDNKCMAYLTDGAYNVLAYNQLWADVFEGSPPKNMLEWMMLNDQARGGPMVKNPVLVDWGSQWAPCFVTQLKHVVEMSGGKNQQLNQMLTKVKADPRALRAYSSYADTPIHSDGACRPFHHPNEGRGYVRLFPVSLVGSAATIMRLEFTKMRPTYQTVLTAEGEVQEEIA
ncbi:XRE family transcriptional regulator [Streptomyces inhibens]|uniref:XRE family transcriptional regulator n=1 Tax=Streptomyces inhibens TaxID=2293571 RepID=A0A371PQP6_STRIH|nr:helix-turn-helix domain-containing protein [Streptomyces inhibens]REK84511.1 XRE family transcriptional regulator [Streptomyces inhibens]